MDIHNQEKFKLVNSVFDKVYKNYDLMNDIMSLGVHRIWKKNMIRWMSPQKESKIIDVASGTGDLAKIISEKNNNQNDNPTPGGPAEVSAQVGSGGLPPPRTAA